MHRVHEARRVSSAVMSTALATRETIDQKLGDGGDVCAPAAAQGGFDDGVAVGNGKTGAVEGERGSVDEERDDARVSAGVIKKSGSKCTGLPGIGKWLSHRRFSVVDRRGRGRSQTSALLGRRLGIVEAFGTVLRLHHVVLVVAKHLPASSCVYITAEEESAVAPGHRGEARQCRSGRIRQLRRRRAGRRLRLCSAQGIKIDAINKATNLGVLGLVTGAHAILRERVH
eukprot:6172428-Pleurochrysis_carterae.AAC.2